MISLALRAIVADVLVDRGRRFPVLRRLRALAAVVVSCSLVVTLGTTTAWAQSASDSESTFNDIAIRDELIAAQESLLNIYRCRFNIDTHIVPGGCARGQPSQGPTEPGVFVGTPTQRELAVRDKLVADQELLLNVYRCRFNIDTQIVPGGCADGLLTRLDQLRGQMGSMTIDSMNEIRSPQPTLPVLQPDDGLSAIARAHAQAMADAQSFRGGYNFWARAYDFWARLEPDWDFWSIGSPVSTTRDLHDPRLARDLSAALLGDEGSRFRPCPQCTHLATGISVANGTAYATVIMAGRDAGGQLTEAEMAAVEAEMAGLVNELRASLGLNTLTYSPGVAAEARRWSQIMGARLDFNHNPYAGVGYPPGYSFEGENIATVKLTTTPSDAPKLSFGDFVNSPLHYAPMVNPETTHIGVGIVLKAGWLWITLNFASLPMS